MMVGIRFALSVQLPRTTLVHQEVRLEYLSGR